MKKILIVLLYCFPLIGKADLNPSFLSLELTADKSAFSIDETLQWKIRFVNEGDQSRGVLLPGSQNKGNRLIYFSYFTVKNNIYTEVARESAELNMDTTRIGYHDFKYIPAKQSLAIPIFMNDAINYPVNNAAHHKIPDLPIGEYKVLAWYAPFSVKNGALFFNRIDPFGHIDETHYNANRFNVYEDGLMSNYMDIEITTNPTPAVAFEYTEFCPVNCKLCEAIDDNNWSKVNAIIDDQTYYTKAIDRKFIDSNWTQPHRNVVFLYHGPDAILASMPSSTSRRIIFQNKDGYHYYDLTWQLGIVYAGRSRFYLIKRLFAPMRIDIPTENHDFQQLVRFERFD